MGVAEVTFPTVWERRLAYALLYRWYGDVEPAVAIGTSKEKIAIGAASTCMFAGIPAAALTAQDEDVLSGTALAATQACRFLICAQSDGTITATQGPILTLAEITTVSPSRTSSPLRLSSFSLSRPLLLAKSLMALVRALRNPSS